MKLNILVNILRTRLKVVARNSSRKICIAAVLAFLSTQLLSGCISSGASIELEKQASDATLDWMAGEYGLIEDSDVEALFSGLTQRLTKTIHKSALETGHFPRWKAERFAGVPWKLYLVDNIVPNAFSAGAGKIFVTTGLLKHLNSESELAAVVSHEIAHQLLEHPRLAIKTMANQQNAGNQPSFAYSLNQEIDADRLGLKVMSVAGYDVRSALSALSLGYRQESGHISVGTEKKPDLDRRLAELFVEVYDRDSFMPSRGTSRDFSRLQKRIMKQTFQ